MTRTTPERIHAGQAIYSPFVLRVYDRAILGFNSPVLWRCSSRHLLANYEAHLSSDHLDVGVGTGYFLDRAATGAPPPRIVLMDMNPNPLAFASRRLARFAPRTIVHNVLEPVPEGVGPFDSIGINYLLHCIPGSFDEKRAAFENLAAVLRPGGVLFGATILAEGVEVPFLSRIMMRRYIRRGIMNNEADRLDDLRRVLEDVFDRSALSVRGMVGIFSGFKG